jgi:glutamyl-tRNA synthetase
VNNTPRQINILRALGAELPEYGHVPMILGPDGDKLSKRHGAVSVTQYEEAGYLPDAMVNYLARLGWSHGDDELFTREQLVSWFDGHHLAKSPAQWDAAKLNWVNAYAIKQTADGALAGLVADQLKRRGLQCGDAGMLARMCALFKDRCATTVELADWLGMYFANVTPSAEDLAAHVTPALRPGLQALRDALAGLEQGIHRGNDQASPRRAGPENAATCTRRARVGVRSGADAVARRGAGVVPSRDGAGAPKERLKSWL